MARILVVDDDPNSLELAGLALEDGGHEVVLCHRPEEALDAACTHRVDAAVLDVMMPDKNGFDVLRDLRECPATERIPVLFLSALGETPDRVRGLREGAEDYLAKPFDAEELRLRVDVLLRAAADNRSKLQADLDSFHVADILQQVIESRNTGRLELKAGEQRGSLDVHDGRLLAASFAGLAGAEAVLAMLETDRGRCTFESTARAELAAGGDRPIQLRNVLMDAAWLVDELARRRDKVPRAGATLRTADDGPPEVPAEYAGLGIAELYRLLGQLGRSTLAELVDTKVGAPQRVTLAVAWMVDAGAVVVED